MNRNANLNNKLSKQIRALSLKHSDSIKVNNIYLKIYLLNKNIKHDLAKEIAQNVYKYSKLHGRDPDLLLALIRVESNFDPDITSHAGAEGLCQIMPFWKEIFKTNENFFEVEVSIKYSMQILALYEGQYGELEMALIAYNRGNHRIEAALMNGKDPRNGYATKIMDRYDRLQEMNIGR